MPLDSPTTLREWLLDAPPTIHQALSWAPLTERQQQGALQRLHRLGILGFLPITSTPDGLLGLELFPYRKFKKSTILLYNKKNSNFTTIGYDISTILPAWCAVIDARHLAVRKNLEPLIAWAGAFQGQSADDLRDHLAVIYRKRDRLARDRAIRTWLAAIDERYNDLILVMNTTFDSFCAALKDAQSLSHRELIFQHRLVLKVLHDGDSIDITHACRQLLASWRLLDGAMGAYSPFLRPENADQSSHHLAWAWATQHDADASAPLLGPWDAWFAKDTAEAARRWLSLAATTDAAPAVRWSALRNALSVDPDLSSDVTKITHSLWGSVHAGGTRATLNELGMVTP